MKRETYILNVIKDIKGVLEKNDYIKKRYEHDLNWLCEKEKQIDNNHVAVDRLMKTNINGCFAAGDIVGVPYQYIKAAGEGNIAALSAVSYLDELKRKNK